MQPIFITGIGTGVGKTIVSAIVTEALEADYWKPVQAGFEEGTDAFSVRDLLLNQSTIIHPEAYTLQQPSSPHIAARAEGVQINLDFICNRFFQLVTSQHKHTVIEGAGGLLVPLNETEFIIDLIKKLNARVILVSRNYLGSINHSLLTASVCKSNGIPVIGWIFNDQYMHYEDEIERWSGYPTIASIPLAKKADQEFVKEQANSLTPALRALL